MDEFLEEQNNRLLEFIWSNLPYVYKQIFETQEFMNLSQVERRVFLNKFTEQGGGHWTNIDQIGRGFPALN